MTEEKIAAANEDCFCRKMYRQSHDPAHTGFKWAVLRMIFRKDPGDKCCCKKPKR